MTATDLRALVVAVEQDRRGIQSSVALRRVRVAAPDVEAAVVQIGNHALGDHRQRRGPPLACRRWTGQA